MGLPISNKFTKSEEKPTLISFPINQTPTATPGVIVPFYSFVGGVGKSVFAANLAVEMAKMLPRQKIVLVDLNLYTPDITVILDINVNRSRTLKQYFVQEGFLASDLVHSYSKLDNLDIIAGDNDFTWCSQIQPDRLNQLFDELQRTYDYIFVDTHNAIDLIATFIPLHRANKLVWVISPTIPALRSAERNRVEQLRSIGVQGDICLLVTRYDSVKEITTDVIKQETGLDNVYCILEKQKEITDSINRGLPFAFYDKNRKSVRKMREELQKMVSFIADIDLDAIRSGE